VVLYLGICLFYFFFQEKLLFVPLGKLSDDVPIELGTSSEEIYLEGLEDGRIHALHIKVNSPRGCILYFHGNTGNVQRWGPIAEEFTSFGFDVFLPDYRGYGKSRGRRSQEILFSDAKLCYDHVTKAYGEEKICIYGRSLGSAMASWLAGQTKSGGIILETPFNNLRDVAAYHTKIIPVGFLLRYDFKSELHLRHSQSPILIAHGTKDILVPYRLGFKLYKTVKEKAEMLTIPGGHHGDLNGYPVFRERLKKFFDKHFPKRSRVEG
jgi:fermentation-respiration switch protein FrsA (DUF1100 family)